MTEPAPAEVSATPEERFAKRLHAFVEAAPTDGSARASLARLRRALGRRGVEASAFREIGDAIPARRADQSEDGYRAMQDAYLLAAALFATHAAKSDKPWYGGYVGTASNFGASCGRLKGGSGSMDLRFAALLDARSEDLPYRLRQVVSLLAANRDAVGVRYDLLLRDLLRWNAPGRPVQREWAAAYWTPRSSS